MKTYALKNIKNRSLFALAILFTITAPGAVSANSPKEGAMMNPVKNDEYRFAMRERHEKLLTEMKAQDDELAAQVAAIKSAPDSGKLELMITLVSSMVEQRAAMHESMAAMMDEMSINQSPHLRITGSGSMSSRAKSTKTK